MLYAALAAGIPHLPEKNEGAFVTPRFAPGSPEAFQASLHGVQIWGERTLPTANTETLRDDPWIEIQELPYDWDANGAEPVSPAAITFAKRFLAELPGDLTFEPFAQTDGSIGLQHRTPNRSAYLVISPENRFTYVIKVAETVHRGDDVESTVMQALLATIY